MGNMQVLYILILTLILFIFWKKWRNFEMKSLISEYHKKNAVVVDVRSPEEFKGGHCEGSLNIPLNTLEARYLELDKKRPVIVCCASGGRSGMAMNFLKSQGFEDVINAGPWTNARKC